MEAFVVFMGDSSTTNAEADKPWPKSSDALFQSGWLNAFLDYSDPQWDLYATGYKDAADILVDHFFESGGRHGDFLIYPIVFLYRQYLELRLKELIISGQSLLDLPTNLQHVHQLDMLWVSCRTILEQIYQGSPEKDLDVIEKLLKQFSNIDPKSMGFRYPVDKSGISTLPNLKEIDIMNFQEVMEKISNILESASMGISVYLNEKHSIT